MTAKTVEAFYVYARRKLAPAGHSDDLFSFGEERTEESYHVACDSGDRPFWNVSFIERGLARWIASFGSDVDARMEDNPSERLIDQRIRNRIMEAVHTLAAGDAGVREVWPAEYFESFYDWIPHHGDGEIRSNSTITLEELEGLTKVSEILDEACDATPGNMDAEDFITTGWPSRIQPVAQHALALLLARGRFQEDQEEEEPGAAEPWP